MLVGVDMLTSSFSQSDSRMASTSAIGRTRGATATGFDGDIELGEQGSKDGSMNRNRSARAFASAAVDGIDELMVHGAPRGGSPRAQAARTSTTSCAQKPIPRLCGSRFAHGSVMASIAMADMAHSLLKQVRAANDLPETVSAVVVAAMQLLVHHSQVPPAASAAPAPAAVLAPQPATTEQAPAPK